MPITHDCCLSVAVKSASFLAMFSLLACSQTPKHPDHWWASVDRSTPPPSWEILPDQAGPNEVILSKRHELGLLSNFAATPFELDGKRYASLEGFWQSLLYPENSSDLRAQNSKIKYRYTREQVEGMSAFVAKEAGDMAYDNMKKLKIDWVTYQGKRIRYEELERGEHYALIRRATIAKLEQNPNVRAALLSTGKLTLRPDHSQGDNPPASWKYYEIYMDLRSMLQRNEALR
jgi:predicted NAD-dependent protein-ADP-ribosyltransferase YbiA (DUF1768 family)